MAEGSILLSSIQMLGVHSFPRDTFLKTLEKVQGSGIRQHRLIGIPFRKVWGVQNSKKKSSSTWSHIFLHYHALKAGYAGEIQPPGPSTFKTRWAESWLSVSSLTFKAQLSIWDLVAQSNQAKRPTQRWLTRICTNCSNSLPCEFQSTVC